MRKAILCVDDEHIILESLKYQLKDHLRNEYMIEIAQSGNEALEVIEELHEEETVVAAVVSDWLMPGMKGDELLVRIHQQFPDIITLMLTGHADPAAIERAKSEANLYALLRKPWKEEELIDALRAGLSLPAQG